MRVTTLSASGNKYDAGVDLIGVSTDGAAGSCGAVGASPSGARDDRRLGAGHVEASVVG